MIICDIKIINYLKRNHHCLSAASRKAQNELNKILLAQAIVPIFSAFLPMTIHLIGGVTEIDLVFASFIAGILYCWIPVGNAFSVLLFVTAYRRKVKQLIFCTKAQLVYSTGVAPSGTGVSR